MGMIGNFPAIGIVSSANLSDGAVTAPKLDDSASQLFGFRNRIINGDMRIDQRNNGAAVTRNATDNTYQLDRWITRAEASDGVYTVQQVSDAPAGFVNSCKITVTTADASIGAGQIYNFGQYIEGNNVADLAWGTASAQTVALSFWVKSSVTGTFGGAIRNSAVNRSYPYTYTINSANTWEYKTVIIHGDTTGIWLTNNQIGIIITWSLGLGSTYLGTAGSWAAAHYIGSTGQTQLISTLNATWQITGVQLEKGSVATPFEFRPYGTEFVLCQRYAETIGDVGVNHRTIIGDGNAFSSTSFNTSYKFIVAKRASPTISFLVGSGSSFRLVGDGGGLGTSAVTFVEISKQVMGVAATVSGAVAGKAYQLQSQDNVYPKILISAEL